MCSLRQFRPSDKGIIPIQQATGILKRGIANSGEKNMERGNKAEIRNPLLALPAAHRIKSLPVEMYRELRELAALLTEMAQDEACRADKAWSKSKGPMAAYWKAVSVYAKHVRVLCRG
jgi:hypothetical protein